MPTEQSINPTPTESTPTESIPTESAAADPTPTSRIAHGHDAAESDSESDDGTISPDGDRVATLERRVADLEAELEAVRGLLAGVETVDEGVDRRASAALAKAEALEEQFASEETGLVRERLPDPGGDAQRDSGVGERTPEPRDSDAQGAPRRAGSSPRTDGDPGRANRGDSIESRGGNSRRRARGSDNRGPAESAGRGRTNTGDVDAADGGAAGVGAISSVGSGASAPRPETNDAEDADRSLAARLRDAFR